MCVAFLKERIAFVLLIAEDALDGGNAPFLLAAGCRDAVFGQCIGDAVVGHALQEQAVDAFDDDCLLPVDHQIPIRATVVAKEALERNTDLSVCKALSLAPSAVLGNAAAFFLCQRGHDGKQQLALTVESPDVLFFKIDLNTGLLELADGGQAVYCIRR